MIPRSRLAPDVSIDRRRIAVVEYCDLSFAGRREGNEDECLAFQLGPDACFLAVADGMGGLEGGEIASHLVLASARTFLEHAFAGEVQDDDLKHILLAMYRSTQKELAAEKVKRPALRGMGTTLTCVLIKGGKYIVGNVGDSRVYLCRDNALVQVTEDHTFIQQLLRENKKPDAAMLEHYSHYVTRCIEGGTDDPDIFPLDAGWSSLRDGDGFLLCSDGLITDKSDTDPQHMYFCLTGTKDVHAAAEQLVARAFHAGSSDNISVIVATYGNFPRAEIGLKSFPFPPRDHETPSPPTSARSIPGPPKPVRLPVRFVVRTALAAIVALAIYLGVRHWDHVHRTILSLWSDDETAEQKNGNGRGQNSSDRPDRNATPHEQSVSPWDPFARLDVHPYKPTEQFTWSEFEPGDSLESYEISSGGGWINTERRNYATPDEFRGTRRDNGRVDVKVRVRARLIDKRIVESREITISIQSTRK